MNQATTWNHPDHLHPHDPADHYFLHLQLLQALLLRGHCGRQPHRHVGPRHNVHLCVWGTSQDLIHQDDWCMAGLCASDSFFWGIVFVHALVFVFVFVCPFAFLFLPTFLLLQVLLHTIIDMMRLEYDREVNHHGTIRKVSSSQIKPTSSWHFRSMEKLINLTTQKVGEAEDDNVLDSTVEMKKDAWAERHR